MKGNAVTSFDDDNRLPSAASLGLQHKNKGGTVAPQQTKVVTSQPNFISSMLHLRAVTHSSTTSLGAAEVSSHQSAPHSRRLLGF